MKLRSKKTLLLAIALNVPLVVFTHLQLSGPIASHADMTSFRYWLVIVALGALTVHALGALVLVRWLPPTGSGRQSVANILRGFRGQILICIGFVAVLWAISIPLEEQAEKFGPTPELTTPLVNYSWAGLLILLVLGTLTTLTVSTRLLSVPEARVVS